MPETVFLSLPEKTMEGTNFMCSSLALPRQQASALNATSAQVRRAQSIWLTPKHTCLPHPPEREIHHFSQNLVRISRWEMTSTPSHSAHMSTSVFPWHACVQDDRRQTQHSLPTKAQVARCSTQPHHTSVIFFCNKAFFPPLYTTSSWSLYISPLSYFPQTPHHCEYFPSNMCPLGMS